MVEQNIKPRQLLLSSNQFTAVVLGGFLSFLFLILITASIMNSNIYNTSKSQASTNIDNTQIDNSNPPEQRNVISCGASVKFNESSSNLQQQNTNCIIKCDIGSSFERYAKGEQECKSTGVDICCSDDYLIQQ